MGGRGVFNQSKRPGNFFTMADVEKKMQGNFNGAPHVTRRTSDNTWNRSVRRGHGKKSEGSGLENQGKRKVRDFSNEGGDVAKKGCTKGGRFYKPCSGGVKEDNNGSGMAVAGNQPRRPQ